MKTWAIVFSAMLVLIFETRSIAQESVGITAKDFIGRWEGRSLSDETMPSATETLLITISKAKDNNFSGIGSANRGGGRRAHPTVYGSINGGNNVVLEIYYPEPKNTVPYRCEAQKKNELDCVVGTNFSTTFKKID